tara:strand:+ start:988 stop:1509 length:522 start_codon:yes stop_codon:yes gene_type:complete
MTKALEIPLDAPIAGQGLTHELGNRPWQQPPQFSTVEEAIQFHIPRIIDPDMQEDLMNVIETGVPLTVIAETLQSGAVMQGKHTVDVGILIIPVLMETLAYLAEEQGVKYNMGTKLKTDDTPSESSIALALNKIRKKREESGKEEPVSPMSQVEEVVETEEPPKEGGLMSRRM